MIDCLINQHNDGDGHDRMAMAGSAWLDRHDWMGLLRGAAMAITWLDRVGEAFLETIAPRADRIDRDPVALGKALNWLAQKDCLALTVPTEWGGRGFDDREYGQFRASLARASGVLAFVQAQHQSAAKLIATGTNPDLQARYLPAIVQGKTRLGIAFSHLRQSGSPSITARPVAGGWEINGTAPWVTGLGHFPEAVLAVPAEDKILLAVVPIALTSRAGGRIQPGEYLALAAMAASQTAPVSFERWFVPDEQVVDHKPLDWIQSLDRRNVLHGSYFALGCTQAVLDRLATRVRQGQNGRKPPARSPIKTTSQAAGESLGMMAVRDRPWSFGLGPRQEDPPVNPSLVAIGEAMDQIDQEFNHLRQGIDRATSEPPAPYADQLRLRAATIAMMLRSVQILLVTEAGRSARLNQGAQRLQGEACIFAATGQTSDILAATLTAILAQGSV